MTGLKEQRFQRWILGSNRWNKYKVWGKLFNSFPTWSSSRKGHRELGRYVCFANHDTLWSRGRLWVWGLTHTWSPVTLPLLGEVGLAVFCPAVRLVWGLGVDPLLSPASLQPGLGVQALGSRWWSEPGFKRVPLHGSLKSESARTTPEFRLLCRLAPRSRFYRPSTPARCCFTSWTRRRPVGGGRTREDHCRVSGDSFAQPLLTDKVCREVECGRRLGAGSWQEAKQHEKSVRGEGTAKNQLAINAAGCCGSHVFGSFLLRLQGHAGSNKISGFLPVVEPRNRFQFHVIQVPS